MLCVCVSAAILYPKIIAGGHGFGGKKKMNEHHECTILFRSFLRGAASIQHCGLCPSLHAAHPFLSLRRNTAPSGEHNQARLNGAAENAAEPTELCSSGAVGPGRALCFRSRVVQQHGPAWGIFFHRCFLFSRAQRRRMPGCSKSCHFPLCLRRPHGAVHHFVFVSGGHVELNQGDEHLCMCKSPSLL